MGEKRCRNSHLVKMSLVTAAMLYSSRRARHSFSIKAVFPEPTGLYRLFVSFLFSIIYLLSLPIQCSLWHVGYVCIMPEKLLRVFHRTRLI